MIFYLAVDAEGHTKILGTQADAGKVNKDYSQIDIPTDKSGLMNWVQQMLDELLNSQPQAPENIEIPDTAIELSDSIPSEPVEEVKAAPKPAPMTPQLSKILTVDYIQNWLIEDADQREIERIYNAIGCRIGEMLREDRD
jgi:hypothetical protein